MLFNFFIYSIIYFHNKHFININFVLCLLRPGPEVNLNRHCFRYRITITYMEPFRWGCRIRHKRGLFFLYLVIIKKLLISCKFINLVKPYTSIWDPHSTSRFHFLFKKFPNIVHCSASILPASLTNNT